MRGLVALLKTLAGDPRIGALLPMLPCVGLVVMAGYLGLVIVPDGGAPAGERRHATVIIDPGHGGMDNGAKGNGLVEKELTLDVGLRVEQLLKNKGIETRMTRREDVRTSLSQRAAVAHGVSDPVFVSIHFDQSGYRSARGVQTFYASEKVLNWAGIFNVSFSADEPGEDLARRVQGALSRRAEANSRGVRPRELYVVRHVRGPAVLIEGGFMSNAAEAKRLADPGYRDRLAEGIVEGILEFLDNGSRGDFSGDLAKAGS